jgi:hypothetical protein
MNEEVRKVIKGMKRLKGYHRNEEVRKVIEGMKRLERLSKE